MIPTVNKLLRKSYFYKCHLEENAQDKHGFYPFKNVKLNFDD